MKEHAKYVAIIEALEEIPKVIIIGAGLTGKTTLTYNPKTTIINQKETDMNHIFREREETFLITNIHGDLPPMPEFKKQTHKPQKFQKKSKGNIIGPRKYPEPITSQNKND